MKWKVVKSSDKSRSWLQLDIKELDWHYVADSFDGENFIAFLYTGVEYDETRLKTGVSLREARLVCEKHFSKIVKKIVKKYT